LLIGVAGVVLVTTIFIAFLKLRGYYQRQGRVYFNQTTSRYRFGMDIWGPAWQWVVYRTPLREDSRNWGPWWVTEFLIDPQRVNWVMYQAAKAGVAWNRLTIRASMIYFDPQVYQPEWYWQDLDMMVRVSLDYNINILANVWGNPCPARLALDKGGVKYFANCVTNNDKARPDGEVWRRFLTALFERYSAPGQEKILYYEIWNEPDLDEYFMPGASYQQKAEAFIELLRIADEVRNQVNPNIKLIYGGFSDINGPKLLRAIKSVAGASQVLSQMEAVSAHAYSRHLDKMGAVRQRVGGTPIWVTEQNGISNEAEFRLDEPSLGVEKVFWFRAVSSQWGPGLFNKAGKEWEADEYTINQPFYDNYQAMVNQQVYDGPMLDWRRLVEPEESSVVVGDVNGNGIGFERYDVLCMVVKYLKYPGSTLSVSSPYDLKTDRILDRVDVIRMVVGYLKNNQRSGTPGTCTGL